MVGKFCGDDVFATIDFLTSLGAKIDVQKNLLTVMPISSVPKKVTADAKSSGSTLRFMLPVCACFDTETTIIGSERLAERPIKKLLVSLKKAGASFSSDRLPVTVSGKINASESSQFVTGLMLALPKIGGGKIVIKGKKVSGDYLKITASVMRSFGVTVAETDSGYIISGSYRSPGVYFVESDWSSAAFFAVSGAIGGEITLKGLKPGSVQGDKKILEAIEKAGAKITLVGNDFRIEKNLLNPFVFDVENCPDCAPSLAVLAAFCDGKSVLLGTGRLKLKESDRSKEIVKILSSFGIEADDKGDRIEINGTGTLRGVQLAAIAASGSVCPSVLSGEQAVSKSYPSFFDDFILLGGKADVLTV